MYPVSICHDNGQGQILPEYRQRMHPRDEQMIELQELGNLVVPIFVSTVLGGVIGLERELRGQWAGLRTHVLVSLGSTVFVLLGMAVPNENSTDITRIIQGIATGIGFIGAGTIIKLQSTVEVKGLTTAASIWLAAAVGTGIGLRQYLLAFTATILCVVVLRMLRWVEHFFPEKKHYSE